MFFFTLVHTCGERQVSLLRGLPTQAHITTLLSCVFLWCSTFIVGWHLRALLFASAGASSFASVASSGRDHEGNRGRFVFERESRGRLV